MRIHGGGLCRTGNNRKAVQLLMNLEERGRALDVIVYATIIEGYRKEHRQFIGTKPSNATEEAAAEST